MRARSLCALALVSLGFVPASPLSGQSVGKMLEADFRNFGGDIWSVWTSPFRAHPSDWFTAGAVVGVAALASPLDDNVDRWMLAHRKDGFSKLLEPVREGGVLFTGRYVTPVAIGALAYGLIAKDQKVQEGLFGCLASYVSGTAVRTYVFYPLIARDRPVPSREISADDAPPAQHGDQYPIRIPGKFDTWTAHSLPAGHAANIVSCVAFLTNRFEMGYVEPALYVVGLGVGVGRMVDRRHWNSDTMLGMVFGYAIGKEIARRSLNRAHARSGVSGGAGASLLDGVFVQPSSNGLTMGWKTTF